MAISFVQKASSGGALGGVNGSASVSATFSSAPAQGNLVVICVGNSLTNNASGYTVTDGNSNSCTFISGLGGTGRSSAQYAYIVGAAPSSTFVASLVSTSLYLDIFEFSGNFLSTNGTASTFYDGALSFASATFALQSTVGDGSIGANTSVGPSITVNSTGGVIVASLAVGSNMGTVGGPAIGDPSGTSTKSFGNLNPTTATFAMTGYEISPSTGTHNPFLSGTSGTSRAGNATTVAYKASTAPTATTQAATNITATSATLNGTLTSNGNGYMTATGFFYASTSTNPNLLSGGDTVGTTTATPTQTSGGTFSVNITGLIPGKTYYFNTYVQNSGQSGFGGTTGTDTKSFTTLGHSLNLLGVGS